MESTIQALISGDAEKSLRALRKFSEENAQVFSFVDLNEEDRRETLWKSIYNLVADPTKSDLHRECLSAIRILSRDKENLQDVITEDRINVLLLHSELSVEKTKKDPVTTVEALKCLCNLIFNCRSARTLCCNNGILEVVVKRSRTYKESEIPIEVQFFDMKILFLITALCAKFRPKLKNDLHGFVLLTDLLISILQENKRDGSDCLYLLPDLCVNLSCEILKTLFNLCAGASSHDTVDENDEETQHLRLASVLRNLLLVQAETNEKKFELVNHIVNLITIMSDESLKMLIIPVGTEGQVVKEMHFEGQDMSTVNEIVKFLRSRFDLDPVVSLQHETLSPVLSALVKCAKSNRAMRKYLRLQILPPLRDVHSRPEQGNTIRNCLCRLLTTPITQVRDLAADFLFVLCKENLGRMIKYTGYGNAAGMLASRGLLSGNDGNTWNYSSGSEDSETEEYTVHKHGINPVVGCYQSPRPNPTAGMTEEQKEYEAMKLVELMDNLTRKGIVQPCTVGRDGRPKPIEHILQLQEGLPNQEDHTDEDN